MKIISLNTWHATQKAELRKFLLFHIDTTDVFCLQETVGGDIEALIAELFDTARFTPIFADKITSEGIHYRLCTIVAKPLEITRSHTPLNKDDSTVGIALAVNIAISGQAVSIVNMHGAPFPGHKLDTEGRLRQTEQLLTWLRTNDSPAVICGDFNLLPQAESIKRFAAAGYRNLIAEYNIPTTRNSLAWDKHPDSKQLFADYTFISPELSSTEFTVPNSKASDHLPMITTIKNL